MIRKKESIGLMVRDRRLKSILSDDVRANLFLLSLTARRNKENVQRTQITFPFVKASLSSAHVTITRFTRPAPFFLKAACSTLDLVRATCQYSSLSVFSASRGIPRGGREEGINISRELITALGRYKVYSREEDREKYCVTAILRAKCLPGGGREILYGCVLYAERRVSLARKRNRGGGWKFYLADCLSRPTCLETRLEIYLIIYKYIYIGSAKSKKRLSTCLILAINCPLVINFTDGNGWKRNGLENRWRRISNLENSQYHPWLVDSSLPIKLFLASLS